MINGQTAGAVKKRSDSYRPLATTP